MLCSNLRYSWVTCVVLSNFCSFSQIVLSAHPLLVFQPLSSYQTFVIFSPFVIYSLFYVIWRPINAPAVHTTNTTPAPVVSCARSLRQYTFLTHQASLAIMPFWLWGDRDMAGGGVLEEQPDTLQLPQLRNVFIYETDIQRLSAGFQNRYRGL